jgi:antitoxin ParD1/3/4
MATMSISLSDDMRAFVEAQVARRGYASANEYFRALVRDAQRREAKLALEAKLMEGLESPASELTDADWAALRQRIVERSPELRESE